MDNVLWKDWQRQALEREVIDTRVVEVQMLGVDWGEHGGSRTVIYDPMKVNGEPIPLVNSEGFEIGKVRFKRAVQKSGFVSYEFETLPLEDDLPNPDVVVAE